MQFEIVKKSKKTKARKGILHTKHGPIETPVFMPVGTQGTLKALTWPMVEEIGAQIVLGNTYHLALRPGIELIKEFGGLHQFTGWNKPILTDSGGYQVFSLAKMRKITKNGVEFQSHLDGKKLLFTPKSVVDLQLGFNSDILMPLDICSEYPAEYEAVKKELKITTAWEEEAKKHWEKKEKGNLLFAIVQGGMFKDLREQSAKELIDIDFPGYAIGGLSVGEPKELMDELIPFVTDRLPENKPRYLMGVGLPENLEYAISQGVDMFDCVAPTRLARHGHVFTNSGKINLKNQQYVNDKTPLDKTCSCSTCKNYSKAYLRHLLMAKEISGIILLTYHNVYYLVNLVKRIGTDI
jgi:queuine tRNA-ribosyltransferase